MNLPQLDDYLSRLQDHDEEAFQIVYDATKNGVYAILIALVKNRQTTEDLMQETYIRMLEKLHTYQRGRNFQAWITQIAKNLAFDYLRKNQRTILADIQDPQSPFDQAKATDSTEMSFSEMISSLDPTSRELIALKMVSNLPFREIAKIMNKPLGTILWLYQKALKDLKKQMKGEE